MFIFSRGGGGNLHLEYGADKNPPPAGLGGDFFPNISLNFEEAIIRVVQFHFLSCLALVQVPGRVIQCASSQAEVSNYIREALMGSCCF